MKTLRVLILGLLIISMLQPFIGKGQTGQPSSPVAEAITPDIQALARGLQNDPVQIFNYVHDHIRFDLYFGSEKGAEITLLEKSGNDFDQCALLVALLRSAGYSPEYEFGLAAAPYDATNGSDIDWQHWLQASLVNTNWGDTSYYFPYLTGTRGYPTYYAYSDNNSFGLQHVWITLSIGGTNYLLDPSFKVSESVAGISLTNAMGFNVSSLLTAAGGTDTPNYVTNVNDSSLRTALTGYTTNLFNYLQSNMPNATVQQVLGGWQIVPSTNTSLSQSLPFVIDSVDLPVENWTYEPTNLMASFSVAFAGTNYFWWMPQLEGQRISLTYSNNGVAQLWQDDSNLVRVSTTASQTNYILSITHPFGSGWDPTNNVVIDPGQDDQSVTDDCQETSSTYVFPYAFDPDWGWLHQRQSKLDAYRLSGLPNSSQQITEETLNIFALTWVLETTEINRILAMEMGMLPENLHTLGRTGQETGGFFIDIHNRSGDFPATGYADPVSQDNSIREPELANYFGSALESGVIQQLQPTNLAASTVRILEIAATNHQAVFLATGTNWANIQGQLTGYGSALGLLEGYADAGYYLLIPQNGNTYLSGTSGWHGYGVVIRYYNPTYMFEDMSMLITGAYNGGYSGGDDDADDFDLFDDSFWSFYFYAPFGTPFIFGADPVDMADGTYQIENTDLSLGQDDPRGIKLTRYYNGVRRNTNPVGLSGGWFYNYYATALPVAAPWPVLGEESPQQMVAMLAATSAAASLYNSTPDAENWLVTALAAKWGTDQLISNAVSVTIGKDTVEFIKQPNGAYTPPPNCTMTLISTNSAYDLQIRHGNMYKFDSIGRLTNIVDQYGNGMKFTYNASNWIQTITDWTNRMLTFTYSTTSPSRLAYVSDGTRTVQYGYSTAYNSVGDLTSFTDAQGNTNGYIYDTNHDITASIDGQGRLIVTNIYDNQGHIATQYVEGDTNKTWQVFWTGWKTTEQDPVGSQRIFAYDDQTRLTSVQDQLGHVTQMAYDGQNHITTVVSPLNETNQYVYDINDNLLESMDALGFTNQNVYDGSNNLIEEIDPRGNPTMFGYNAQFSLTGQTNGAGDYVSYSYNPNGTLANRTDSGGMTTYGYDTFGQLKTVIFPNGLGTNIFANSFLGDVTNKIDGRGFATAFQYNGRRQLTNTIEPTNLITKVAYDPEGNQASGTDGRGNITSASWNPTKHLISTTLPTLPQGTPLATNIYDSREWLVETLDPLQNPTTYAHDNGQNLVAQTDPLSRTTAFTYDADNRKIATTNAATEVTAQTWDAKGEMIKLVDGAGHISFRTYDGAGDQIVLTNRNTNAWSFHFDGANRLTNTVSPRGRSTTVVFNHQGLPIQVTDPMSQVTTNGYDAKGRLTNRADKVASTFYGYDANDNRTSIVENGLTNSWTYDAYNRIASYTDVYGNLIQYRYDGNGNVTNLIYPGNRNVYYAYDSNNHLTNVTDWSNRKTSITHDLDGRVTGIYRPNGTYRTISYDSAGEVTNILEQMANGLPIALMRYKWDLAARMSLDFIAPLQHTNSPPTRYMGYDPDNELATFQGPTMSSAESVTPDADGNLLSGPLTNDIFATYTYDARNRLRNVGGITNYYDAANNRIEQAYGTNSIEYVINPNARLPQVLERVKNGITTYYIYGPGLLYQITEALTGTNTFTYHYDTRGSTIALTGDNGLVTDRMEYSLYATMTYHIGTNDTPFLFNGRGGVMTDSNGLLYMRARYYSPYLCRFLNPDPSGFSAGMNFYAYANGNPASMTDPTGLDAQSLSSPIDLSNPFSLPNAESGWNYLSSADLSSLYSSSQPDLASAPIWAIDQYEADHPTVYQPTEPSSLSIFLAGLSVFGGELFNAAFSPATSGSQMTTVIGSGQDVQAFMNANGFQSVSEAQQAGFNVFDAQGLNAYEANVQNALWFNNALQRGDDILQITEPEGWGGFLNTLPGGYPIGGSGYLDTEIPILQNYENVNVIQQFHPLPAH